LSLYFIAQWRLSENLEQLNERFGSNLNFEYSSARVSPFGNLVLNNVTISFIKQDAVISVGKIEYSTGNIFDTTFLYQHLYANDIPENLRLSFNDVVLPLTPTLIKYLSNKEADSTTRSLLLSACGDVQQMGIKEYSAMGYDYFAFSGGVTFQREQNMQILAARGWLDIEETARLNFDMNLSNITSERKELLAATKDLTIDTFNADLRDNGLNRRKLEYCASKSQLAGDGFIEANLATIKQRLNSVGINLTMAGVRSYKEWIQPGSQLELSIEPVVNFTFNDFGFYDEAELRRLLGLDLKINGRLRSHIFDHWALDKFNTIRIRNAYDSDINTPLKRFETVYIKRVYHQEPVEKAPGYIGYKIKLVRSNGKTSIGTLNRISKNKLYVDIKVQAGILQTAIKVERIKEFHVYR
ncbi:MAG: hypothetical protein L3J46_04445, partial [Kangiellaceae bacterium]|nr:hypothetical protein [Kangiellaceae bacterium]